MDYPLGLRGEFEVGYTPVECCELLTDALERAGDTSGIVGLVSLEEFTLVGASRHAFGVQPVLHGLLDPSANGTHVSYQLRFERPWLPIACLFNAAWPVAWLLWLVAVVAWILGALPFWQVILLAVANLVLGVLLRRAVSRKPTAAQPIQFLHAALKSDEHGEHSFPHRN